VTGTTETVTLTRAEYEALIERIEDAEDLAAVAAAEAREAAPGKKKARADYPPIELVRRLSAGEHPVRVWRVHHGLTDSSERFPRRSRRARQARGGFAYLARRSRGLARAALRMTSASFDYLVSQREH
jgi:hypothetical protein